MEDKDNVVTQTQNKTKLNDTEWVKFISYYRHYIDRFAIDILGLKLFPFQRLLLRAMARNQYIMLICCRGLGKSFIVAVFMVCMAILYPGIKLGIASGKGQQARMVIMQKIQGELYKNENVAKEIINIRTREEDCVVEFSNGSEIRAIVLGKAQTGDTARGWRFNVVLVDEARLVKDAAIEEVLKPMTKTKRQAMIDALDRYPDMVDTERGKIIFISSAYLKTCDLYKRFLTYYKEMQHGTKGYFVCSLDYTPGVRARFLNEDEIMAEKESSTMTEDKFLYEYCGVFVGSSNESYYPYELTTKSRVLTDCELEQPKKTACTYVITHDVAVSDNKGSDNACTHVIKLKPRPNGTFIKEVVFSKVLNGASLSEQRDFLRELVHFKFPNTEKLVIDAQSAGQGLLSLLMETWEYKNAKGELFEFPPLIADDDDDALASIPNAKPIVRAIQAYNKFNNDYYPYMKTCFEDGSLRLMTDSSEVMDRWKNKEISAEEYLVHVEHDLLIQELSNIKQEFTDNSNQMVYTRIIKRKKRDRATSLMYGLSYICDSEKDSKARLYAKDPDIEQILSCVVY